MAKDKVIVHGEVETRKHVIINRLRMVAAKLWSLPDRKFNFSNWAATNSGDTFCDLNECGTVACALGWATTIPALKRKGLVLRKDGDYSACAHVCIDGYETFGQELFGIDAHNIFFPRRQTLHGVTPSSSCTAKEMAAFLEKYADAEEAA